MEFCFVFMWNAFVLGNNFSFMICMDNTSVDLIGVYVIVCKHSCALRYSGDM